MKKGDTRVVGWSRLVVVGSWEMGCIPTSQVAPHRRRGGWLGAILHPPLPTPKRPISAHIDEDALEGLYFAFSSILRCLPYFSQYRRPTSSYELLEAFSPSLGRCGASCVVGVARRHPPSPTPHAKTPHLSTHRRGCSRRALFRVFVHPKVFALLFAENAS